MSYVFRLFLTFTSLMLSLVIFCVNQEIVINSLHPYLSNLPNIVSYMLYLVFVFKITWISIWLSKFLGLDTLDGSSITSIEPANDAFLPSYLGYFFVALSVTSIEMFIFVFGIICIFIFHSRISYFNPVFFLFGFNFYYVVNNMGIKVLLITRKQIKDPANEIFNKLRRVNNYTFIDMEDSN